MNTDFLANKIDNAMRNVLGNERVARVGLKSLIIPALLVVAAMSFSGCAGDYYAVGYGPAYYVPDYGPFYVDYGYADYPYWGPGPYYAGEIIVGGVHHRSHYGGHHFVHEWRGSPHGGVRGVSRAPGGNPVHIAPADGGRRP